MSSSDIPSVVVQVLIQGVSSLFSSCPAILSLPLQITSLTGANLVGPRCCRIGLLCFQEAGRCMRQPNLSVMATLWNRAGHYIFAMWFLLSFLFFPRLISAVADWMSTILPHMVWPKCKFRMQVWNVLHAARWKYRMQEWRKKRHLRTIAQLCRAISSQLRHVSTIGKKTC